MLRTPALSLSHTHHPIYVCVCSYVRVLINEKPEKRELATFNFSWSPEEKNKNKKIKKRKKKGKVKPFERRAIVLCVRAYMVQLPSFKVVQLMQ